MELEAIREVHSVETYPWRRFFARSLDFFIYNVLWGVFLTFVVKDCWLDRGNIGNIVDLLVGMGLTMLVEPVLLTLVGTTAGKWILGVHITNKDGERLSYSEGFLRTWYMLFKGIGFNIPIYHLIRLIKCYNQSSYGESLPWEENSKVIVKDEKKWRIALYVAVGALLSGVIFIMAWFMMEPKHHGEISAKEFCENYNQYALFNAYRGRVMLDQDGVIIAKYNGTKEEKSEFKYTETDGVLTKVSVTKKIRSSSRDLSRSSEEMLLLIRAYLNAQKENTQSSDDSETNDNELAVGFRQDFEIRVNGIKITYKCDNIGGLFDDIRIGNDSYEPEEDLGIMTLTMEKQ